MVKAELKTRPRGRWAFGMALFAFLATGCIKVISVPFGLRPVPQETGACPLAAGSDPVVEGDRLRDDFMKGAPPLRQTGKLDDDAQLRAAVTGQATDYGNWLNEQYRTWRNAQACYDIANSMEPRSYVYLSQAINDLRMADLTAIDPISSNEYLQKANGMLIKASNLSRSARVVYYQAELQVRLRNFAEAERKLNLLIQYGVENASIYTLLGYVLEQTDRPQDAQAKYKRATEFDWPQESAGWAFDRLSRAPVSLAVARQSTGTWNWSSNNWESTSEPFRLPFLSYIVVPQVPESLPVLVPPLAARKQHVPQSDRPRLWVSEFVDQTNAAGEVPHMLSDTMATALQHTERFDLVEIGSASKGTDPTRDPYFVDTEIRGSITSFSPRSREINVDIRVVNATTHSVISAFEAILKYSGDIDVRLDRGDVQAVADRIAKALPKLDEARVNSLNDRELILNMGESAGVRKGLSFFIIAGGDQMVDVGNKGNTLADDYIIAEGYVTSVEAKLSHAVTNRYPTGNWIVRGDKVRFK